MAGRSSESWSENRDDLKRVVPDLRAVRGHTKDDERGVRSGEERRKEC